MNPIGADGLLRGNPTLVGIQVLAVVATILFAGTASVGIVSALKLVMPLRIRVDAEVQGIDLAEQGEEAYHGSDLRDLTGRRTALAMRSCCRGVRCGGRWCRVRKHSL